MTGLTVGMAVRCIDRSSRRDFAEWYADERYSEDMLSLTRRYIIRATLERDGRLGVDIGVPTPWGDPFWSADRFEPCLLREPSLVRAASTPATNEPADAQPYSGEVNRG